MLLERTAQLKYLEEQYAKPGARMLVVYGLRNVGKTGLLKEFAKDKRYSHKSPFSFAAPVRQVFPFRSQAFASLDFFPLIDRS